MASDEPKTVHIVRVEWDAKKVVLSDGSVLVGLSDVKIVRDDPDGEPIVRMEW